MLRVEKRPETPFIRNIEKAISIEDYVDRESTGARR